MAAVISATQPQDRPNPQAGAAQAPRPGGRRPRLYVLDGLRLCAALFVVAFHYTALTIHGSHPWGRPVQQVFPFVGKFTAYGYLGVPLFFLISGFVICLTAWGRSPKQFLVSRVTRLFPAYWFAVLATTLLTLAFGDGWLGDNITAQQTVTNLTMLQSPLHVAETDGVYWTLWCEMVFYLLFLFLVHRGLSYKRVVAFAGIWLIASVVAENAGISLLGTITMPGEAMYFSAGLMMYLMYRFGPDMITVGMTGLCWLLALHQVSRQLPGESTDVGHPLQWWCAAAVVTACFAVLLLAANHKLDFIQWRWLTTAGAMTYPLYLLHEHLGWIVIDHLHGFVPSWVLLVATITFFLYAAWLVHRFVERPLAGFLKRGLTKVRATGWDAPERRAQ
ncbi:acyltransferase family protein [Streptantibioticus silvisoli]|uniref:Acyltransferase n=1 Tax=Streptantibioticus silvisoli TaxID=2705255 RepID=A0ABT6VSW0_9ACTN|nr:acyltransferase [Streptantibioticus silvisoli]MDI5961561.1 acyltransferase [Streptantibioticus silvisoli]